MFAGEVIIEDLGSKNGTLVNGARIAAPTALGDGDEIAIGGTQLVFRRSEPAGETKTGASA